MDDGPALAAEYFDGRSARAQPVRLRWQADGALRVEGEALARRLAPADVQWPEPGGQRTRIAHLALAAGGGSLHGRDAAAWDAFVAARPRARGWRGALLPRESLVVRAQRSGRATLIALVLLVALGAAAYRWGVPAAARAVVAALPHSADAAVGELALDGIDGRWLRPSALPPAQRARLAAGFARMVAAAYPDPAQRPPPHTLRFHAGTLGPNAFALPGGTIVVTDELVQLLDGHDDAVLGVMAHELGHVHERHGMRLVVQVSLLGTATSIALGDFSGVLAGVPALLGQLAYSRDAEREADAHSVRMLRAAGLPPQAMVVFFERVNAWRDTPAGRQQGAGVDLGIALSSHPADADRVAFFRAAAP